jgi:restriction system protein
MGLRSTSESTEDLLLDSWRENMSNTYVRVGDVEVQRSVSGSRILKYFLELSHSGLKEHKIISAPEEEMLIRKKEIQIAKWEDKWAKLCEQQKRHADAQEAERLTREAEKQIEYIGNILNHTLNINDAIDWGSLKVHDEFSEARPESPKKFSQKKYPPKEYPPKPERSWPQFNPPFTLFEKIFSGLKSKKIEKLDEEYRKADEEHRKALDEWGKQVRAVDKINQQNEKGYKAAIESWEINCATWEKRKAEFLVKQDAFNTSIDNLEQRYKDKDQNAVEQYCEMVLNNSQYPEYFSKEFELLYNPETKILLCEYYLPNPESVPRLKEVKYIAAKKELRESFLAESQAEKLYDSMIYQVLLRTIHELFEADTVNALEAISLNGRVRHISKATGKEEDACIVSIQVKRQEFLEIDLKNVDPKICFKSLKGIGSSKLHGITPVKPILQIDKSDRRFVQAYDVADGMDDSTNIAAMDWEEFEHLIRELFEKEFSENGGEVKITQASRDGGVDAVAFDPDPIRGGKIVIQAKRYTNTVGVSAVRDLYGTVVNEGATKGILVTTADYGPDAYEFAKNKPLTLLNGGNLLHLLEKHGHKVKIDIKEAKKILGEKE